MNRIFRFSKNVFYSSRSGIQPEKLSTNTAQFGSESILSSCKNLGIDS